jgi:hypothetical protein
MAAQLMLASIGVLKSRFPLLCSQPTPRNRPHSAFTITIDTRAFVHNVKSQRNITEHFQSHPNKLSLYAKKHNANMTSTDRVLVYHHRHSDSNPIIPNGLAVITTSGLDDILQNRKFSGPSPHCYLQIC